MKVFVSSVIGGMEGYRDAAERGILSLGHEPRHAEDYGASPETPQRRCLEGVRDADVVVLLVGERYGQPQESGLSPTHEEYEEARERKPVLTFVQRGARRGVRQEAFLEEVRGWSSGHYTEDFSSEEELQGLVTRRLHEYELSLASGTVDEEEMASRAADLAPTNSRFYSSYLPSLAITVVGGPAQTVLRAAELEDLALEVDLQRGAMFGGSPVFDRSERTESRQEGRTLALVQERASLLVDQQGSVRVTQPAAAEVPGDYSRSMVLIEEELQERAADGLRFAGWVLDRVDPRRRLSDVLIIVHLSVGGMRGWRTRDEHRRNPSGAVAVGGMGVEDPVEVRPDPAVRRRAALSHDAEGMAREIAVLLRRRLRP